MKQELIFVVLGACFLLLLSPGIAISIYDFRKRGRPKTKKFTNHNTINILKDWCELDTLNLNGTDIHDTIIKPKSEDGEAVILTKSKNVFNNVKFSTLRLEGIHRGITEFAYDGVFVAYEWRLGMEEYERAFSHFYNTEEFKNSLRGFVERLITKQDQAMYLSLLYKYEMPLGTALNALKHSVETIGWIPEEVDKKASQILDSFLKDANELQDAEKEDTQKDLKATDMSISSMLDFELEYIKQMKKQRESIREGIK